jgi:hypothetical protein
LTIHGSGSVLAAVTTTTTSPSSSTSAPEGEISMQVPSDQTLELSFTNKSQQPQTVSYYLVLDYERTIRGN